MQKHLQNEWKTHTTQILLLYTVVNIKDHASMLMSQAAVTLLSTYLGTDFTLLEYIAQAVFSWYFLL